MGTETTNILIERFANTLGLPIPTGNLIDAAKELAQGVGGRKVLVLLDNAEPVIAHDQKQVTQFIEALIADKRAPHLLVTSRKSLDIEKVWTPSPTLQHYLPKVLYYENPS